MWDANSVIRNIIISVLKTIKPAAPNLQTVCGKTGFSELLAEVSSSCMNIHQQYWLLVFICNLNFNWLIFQKNKLKCRVTEEKESICRPYFEKQGSWWPKAMLYGAIKRKNITADLKETLRCWSLWLTKWWHEHTKLKKCFKLKLETLCVD